MCSAFTPDCGYDNSTIILIGDVYCPNAKCLGKLCLHKGLFNLSAEAIINARNAHLCVRCGLFFLKIKQIPFSCRLVKGLAFLKRIQNSFTMSLEMLYCPCEYCLNREKCKSIGGYVTTPRSIYGCDTCGAWLFAQKVHFTLQEQVKTTKTDKTRFFSAK